MVWSCNLSICHKVLMGRGAIPPPPPPRTQASAKPIERKVAFLGHMANEGANESSPSEWFLSY